LFGAVEDVAETIASGHALIKHLAEFADLGVKDKEGLAKVVAEVLGSTKSETKALSGGRTAYYDSERNIIVFHDPSSRDKGTVFRPTDGRAYFDTQIR
jgi:filamentous hemagglutinin